MVALGHLWLPQVYGAGTSPESAAPIKYPQGGVMQSPPTVRLVASFGVLIASIAPATLALGQPVDPGVRHDSSDGGPPIPLPGLASDELSYFQDGFARFTEVEVVAGGANNGLGPRFNSNQCSSCHLYPTVGGSSPPKNPLSDVASADGARNLVPWFIAANGPVREARFVQSNGLRDGGVHDLFVVTGRADAGQCNISQPDFGSPGDPMSGQGGNHNVIFRIPTPNFGAGLIEAIPDSAILANMNADVGLKSQLGIQGHANSLLGGTVNLSANDGTITRFGWKAQNKSLVIFAGEAYNVEMGISNEVFPQERDETPSCRGQVATPEDANNFSTGSPGTLSDVEAFANFMRMLAPPAPAASTPSTVNGRAQFVSVGCAYCHTPSLKTGTAIRSGSSRTPSAALSGKQANLFSDLLLHHMGPGLADGITQGAAGPDEFRTAPLWGLGKRIFFLHDGRTTDLLAAIQDHSSPGSEASVIIQRFNSLSADEQQDLLNFLRSL